MFPIGDDDRDLRTTPVVTYLLILANIAVFLYELSLGGRVDRFMIDWGAVPRDVLQRGEYWTLLTSMFIHGGFAHIFGNMIFLKVFGDNIEDYWGHLRFLLFYMVTGLAASLAFVLLNAGSTVPSVGASGAISGVLGAYIILF
jgi:membrane associated rhomboid family serine protease